MRYEDFLARRARENQAARNLRAVEAGAAKQTLFDEALRVVS